MLALYSQPEPGWFQQLPGAVSVQAPLECLGNSNDQPALLQARAARPGGPKQIKLSVETMQQKVPRGQVAHYFTLFCGHSWAQAMISPSIKWLSEALVSW